MIKSTTYFLTILVFIVTTAPSYAKTDVKSQEYQITATDGTDLSLIRYPAQGDYLIIWIAPGYGVHERSIQVAQQLAADGIEIWQIDLAEALFLPRSTEQMRSFTGHYVADLIQIAHKETNK